MSSLRFSLWDIFYNPKVVDPFLYLTSFCQHRLKSMKNRILLSFTTSLQNTWTKLKIWYFSFVLPCLYSKDCRLVSSQWSSFTPIPKTLSSLVEREESPLFCVLVCRNSAFKWIQLSRSNVFSFIFYLILYLSCNCLLSSGPSTPPNFLQLRATSLLQIWWISSKNSSFHEDFSLATIFWMMPIKEL